jgi:replicative DNA helicase
MVTECGAHIVIIDSIKDAAIGVVQDEIAARYNIARQKLLALGDRQLIELHHFNTSGSVYGSMHLKAGAGSVLELSGQPGGATAKLIHAKQPAQTVGPLTIVHDRVIGEMAVKHATPAVAVVAESDDEELDLVEWVRDRGDQGATAAQAAEYLYGSNGGTSIERARYALDRSPELQCIRGSRGRGGNPTRWVAREYASD